MADHTAFVIANTAVAAPLLLPEVRLHLATEVTPLWHATEATLDREGLPPPYWAFAWPGGQALARYLLDRPETVRGRLVLDLGAGCGIAAIAALKAGATRAIAAETDPFAAAAIALNAALNGVVVTVESQDFLGGFPDFLGGFPADSVTFPTIFDDVDDRWTILVGDMCYERPLAARVIAFLGSATARGAAVLLADPGRAYLPKDGLDWLASYDVPTSLDLEDRPVRATALYRWRGRRLSTTFGDLPPTRN